MLEQPVIHQVCKKEPLPKGKGIFQLKTQKLILNRAFRHVKSYSAY